MLSGIAAVTVWPGIWWLFLLPFGVLAAGFAVWAAVVARTDADRARTPLGCAIATSVAIALGHALTMTLLALLFWLVHLAILAGAWLSLERARQQHRAIWGQEHQTRMRRHLELEKRRQARPADDELSYLDDAVDEH